MSRTLFLLTRVEPTSLYPKITAGGSGTHATDTKSLFAADLARFDERQVPHPYLAESLPELNTESWRVFPDGRMETTYKLREGLVWHDGTPLSAEDFVFAWRVHTDPETGTLFNPPPHNFMEQVVAPEPRTLVIRWLQRYPEAGAPLLGSQGFPPLPRHVLGPMFEEDRGVAFANHPFWTNDYIGLGPYRLERWEPGAFIEATAFQNHVLGRPKIERIRVQFASDPNTALANLLAGAAHLATDETIRFQQGSILKREWAPHNGGTVLLDPAGLRYVQIQFRPEVANPREILDLRVRKALAHAIDKQSFVNALLDGEGRGAEMMGSPVKEYSDAGERAVVKYPYDLRRTEQLMREVGFIKGADGLYASAGGDRFSPQIRTLAGGLEEQEAAILTDGLRQAGINATFAVLSAAQSQDGPTLAGFSAFATATTGIDLVTTVASKLATERVPRAENRWRGANLGGWSNPEYDRLYTALTATLDRVERNQIMVQAMKLLSEELPAYPLYYNFAVVAHVAGLHGPMQGLGTTNVHEWQWR